MAACTLLLCISVTGRESLLYMSLANYDSDVRFESGLHKPPSIKLLTTALWNYWIMCRICCHIAAELRTHLWIYLWMISQFSTDPSIDCCCKGAHDAATGSSFKYCSILVFLTYLGFIAETSITVDIRVCCAHIFTETCLHQHIQDRAAGLDGRTLFRADRSQDFSRMWRGGQSVPRCQIFNVKMLIDHIIITILLLLFT